MTILDALKAVASHDPDLARDRNFVGFSGLDTRFACKLAALDRLSPKQEIYAARFVRKYRKQVFEYLGGQNALKGKAKVTAVDTFLTSLTWENPTLDFTKAVRTSREEARGKVNAMVSKVTGALKGFVIRMRKYDPELVTACKQLPNRAFKADPQDKRWVTPGAAGDVLAVAALVKTFNLAVTEATRTFLVTV